MTAFLRNSVSCGLTGIAIFSSVSSAFSAAFRYPSIITVGNSLNEFAKINFEAEDEALAMYREIIKMATELGDIETKLMFERIYSDEEKHLLFFNDLLKIEDEPSIPEADDAEWLEIFDEDYIALLNKAAAAEFSAIVQYTTQHEKTAIEKLRMKKSALEVVTDSNKASVISSMLKPIFRQEMDHLELILERIYEVGKEAIANVDPIPKVGKSTEEFITLDREAENTAILLYRKIISKAAELGDIKTKKMFEDILVDEENHYFQFDDYL